MNELEIQTLNDSTLKNDIIVVDFIDGTEHHYQNELLHRDNDQPAVIDNGTKIWYQNGELHRDNDLPAVTYPNGIKQWYQNGLFIRNNIKKRTIKINYE